MWLISGYHDTMFVLVVDRLNGANIHEIWETEDEKKLSVKKLKEKYTAYAKSCFIKQPSLVVQNMETEWDIEVSSKVIKEWWKKSRTRPRIIAIQLLNSMIETAALIETTKDTKHTPGIESVSEFSNYCKINGELHNIRIIIKKQLKRRFAYYYSAIITDNKKP